MATNCLAIDAAPVELTRPPGFDELYQQYSETVYRTARRITGNPTDAEDVLQTVFLRVLSRSDIGLDLQSAEAYFRRAATNASIDVLRRRTTRSETPIEGIGPQSVQESSPILKEQLRRAIAGLDPEDAQIFLEGWSSMELAKQFGIERGTVGSRLFRIRQVLQKVFER
jgi:RNA polymerase sigma factor (sigma-70 family)